MNDNSFLHKHEAYQIGAYHFLNWRSSQKITIIGGRIMYDIEGHHKYLEESELYGYWLENIFYKYT
jgi:hypothetical protein